jgi:hypothetical protein
MCGVRVRVGYMELLGRYYVHTALSLSPVTWCSLVHVCIDLQTYILVLMHVYGVSVYECILFCLMSTFCFASSVSKRPFFSARTIVLIERAPKFAGSKHLTYIHIHALMLIW